MRKNLCFTPKKEKEKKVLHVCTCMLLIYIHVVYIRILLIYTHILLIILQLLIVDI